EQLEQEQARSEQTIERLEGERTETAAAIEFLEEELARSQETMDEMHAAIEQLDDDRAQARQTVERLRQERDALELDGSRLRATVAEQTAAVHQHRDQIAILRHRQDELAEIHRRAVGTIETQDAAHADLTGEAERLRRRIDHRERHIRALREVIEEHRTSRIYRVLVRLGRWRPYEEKLRRTLHGVAEAPLVDGKSDLVWTFEATSENADGGTAAVEETPAIAVDLTALLPGGENGGAKLVATALVRQMSRLAPERRIVLLTSEPCHRELAALEGENVRRLEIDAEPTALGDVLRHQPLSLLLCPMTAPLFADPRVPLICVVHDLQYQAYPEFFSSEERATRDRDFRRAVEVADRIVTVSEYVRHTVLDSSGLDAGRVVAIHNGLAQQLPEMAADRVDEILARHGLERGRFLLYPANFWPHKNHRMLLAAYGRFRHRRPDAAIKLVLTGADRPDPGPILDAARGMGLGDAVVYPGFVPEDELMVLMRSCLALIFPSLYEGFGMPVVEAMACGRPVLASNAASIPEVAGDAALLFDPRKPEEITAAVERLVDEPGLAAELGGKGPARARRIADSERMARAYLEVIDDVLASPRPVRDGLFGVHGDGWTAPRFIISHGAGPSPPWSPSPTHPSHPPGRGGDVQSPPRTLEMELLSPPGSAAYPVMLTARSSSGETHRASLAGRPVLRLRCRLPAEPGWIELEVEPHFAPKARGVNADTRELGLKLQQCRLIDGGGEVDLLAGA
ncbi:MAG: glycosyltransferase, partial [Thermoanaerobaculia bacterium]